MNVSILGKSIPIVASLLLILRPLVEEVNTNPTGVE